MNFEFAEQINPYLEKLNFEEAINIAESELKKLPTTSFHAILGKSLIAQAEGLLDWIEHFYNILKTKPKALYFEMNEFDINTDMWFIDAFALDKDGGLDLDDMDWLCDYYADTFTETETVYQIENFEKVQTAFAEEADDNISQTARDWCEQIIIARFMELMRTSHLIAKQKNAAWSFIPIYFTTHDYDFTLKSEN